MPGFVSYAAGASAPAASSAPAGDPAGLPPLYTGQVATLCRIATQPVGGSHTGAMCRTPHVATDAIVNPTLLFPSWYVAPGTANLEVATSGVTLKAAIEYPVGTYILANECVAKGGDGLVPRADGLTALTFNASIPRGAPFFVRTLQRGTSANVIVCGGIGQPGFWPASVGLQLLAGPDYTTSGGAFADATGGQYFAYGPIAILSPTRRPSFLLVGDSRTMGNSGGEKVTDATGNIGHLGRLLGRRFGVINLGMSGAKQSEWNAASRTYREQLLPYVSHVANAYGINDLNGGGSAAQLAADRATAAAVWRAAGKLVVGATISGITNSTDGWATLANQTAAGGGTLVPAFNDLVRAGIAGENVVLDLADLADPMRTGKFAVSRDPLGSGGVAGFGTVDGLHESPALNALIRDRGAGAAALLG